MSVGNPNPPEEVENLSRVFDLAQAAVKDSGIDSGLHWIAFSKAVDVLTRFSEPSLNQPDSPGKQIHDSSRVAASIGSAIGVYESVIDDLFVIEGDSLRVTVPTKKLHPKKSHGAKQLALLVTLGRQAAGIDDEWTKVEEIREVCKYFNKFDPGNFGRDLGTWDDLFQIRGKRLQREVRLKQSGLDSAKELVVELGGMNESSA